MMVKHLLIVYCLLLSGCAVTEPTKLTSTEPKTEIVYQQPLASVADGSIYSTANHRFLFEDIKARRVGDLITVLLDERTNATKSASTNTSKNTGIGMPSPTLFGMTPTIKGKEILNMDIDSDISFAGGADSTQSNQLSGEITVTIANVYPNGNMRVQGEKLLTLNQGSEIVRISGVIRPADIAPDNTIISTMIADAQITYSGKGPLADSNTPGWFTRLLGSVIWPF